MESDVYTYLSIYISKHIYIPTRLLVYLYTRSQGRATSIKTRIHNINVYNKFPRLYVNQLYIYSIPETRHDNRTRATHIYTCSFFYVFLRFYDPLNTPLLQSSVVLLLSSILDPCYPAGIRRFFYFTRCRLGGRLSRLLLRRHYVSRHVQQLPSHHTRAFCSSDT